MENLSPEHVVLSEVQRRELCELLGRALVQIRGLSRQGNYQQAADLADAFHSLPTMLYSPIFSWEALEIFFVSYHKMYPPSQPRDYYDYLSALRSIRSATTAEGHPKIES
jgi:hypothetical protein